TFLHLLLELLHLLHHLRVGLESGALTALATTRRTRRTTRTRPALASARRPARTWASLAIRRRRSTGLGRATLALAAFVVALGFAALAVARFARLDLAVAEKCLGIEHDFVAFLDAFLDFDHFVIAVADDNVAQLGAF